MDKQTVTDTHNGILFSLKKEKNSDTYSNMDETWRHWKWKWSHSVVSDSLRPHGLQPARLLCLWDFPGNNTRVGCHFLLQGIFPTQGSNPGLLHYKQMSEPPGKSLNCQGNLKFKFMKNQSLQRASKENWQRPEKVRFLTRASAPKYPYVIYNHERK